jgi:hypothetical protein
VKVINIHRRCIDQPSYKIGPLLDTLASDDDQMLALDKWPRMRLDKGLTIGSKGGHGPIKYTVEEYTKGKCIHFRFTRPTGFHGIHKFEITAVDEGRTEIIHTIDMHTDLKASLQWTLAIRWLHSAFIEDAFDTTERHFNKNFIPYKWTPWVKLLRWLLK